MSDDPTTTVPRLTLPDAMGRHRNRVPGLIYAMYRQLVAVLTANPTLSPAEAMAKAARDLYDECEMDFLLLLERWSQNRYTPPEIWITSSTSRSIYEGGTVKLIEEHTYTLKPFDQLPFDHDNFGEGDAFFDILEHMDASIREEQRHELLDLLDKRDVALGLRSAPIAD